MSDEWTERLSAYLDDELSDVERELLEEHLAGCVACSTTLAELKRVVGRARGLDDRPPAADLWPGIAGRIGATPPAVTARPVVPLGRRRLAFSVPQLLAAGIALVVVSGSAAWFARAPGARVAAGPPAPGGPGAVEAPVWQAALAETHYDRAVADLVRALDQERDVLDSTTVRIVEENLAIIDRAIEQARRALTQDPESEYLRRHLERTVRRKLTVLQRVAAITSRS